MRIDFTFTLMAGVNGLCVCAVQRNPPWSSVGNNKNELANDFMSQRGGAMVSIVASHQEGPRFVSPPPVSSLVLSQFLAQFKGIYLKIGEWVTLNLP